MIMLENHHNEQYFFSQETLGHLANFVSDYAAPCCICAPLLGQELEQRNVPVTILDIDERFSANQGFSRFDINQPEWIEASFDLIICDPPFFNVSLSRLFLAIRQLANFDFDTPVMVSYLSRRANAIMRAFADFKFSATGYHPAYESVQDIERNRIEFFSNLPPHAVQKLNCR